MDLTHDQGQEKVVDFLLQNWRSGKNLNHYISENIERITPPANWPAPDAYFQVPDKKSKIAIEYKPSRETKRGMLTGLGQAISYLERANASYLVSPKMIEDTDMEKFFINLFNEFISEKLPVGLVITEGANLDKMRVVIDIKDHVKNHLKYKYKNSHGCYWANYRDIRVTEVFYILKCISLSDSKEDAWDMFFDTYYCPPKCRTFDLVENDMFDAKMSRGIPGKTFKTVISKYRHSSNIPYKDLITNLFKDLGKQTTFDKFKEKFLDGMGPSLTHDQNLMIFLENKLWYKKQKGSKRGLENVRMDYEKNFKNFIFHIGLVDSLMRITEVGEMFVQRCSNYEEGHTNEEFINFVLSEIGALTLTIGKHQKVINDIVLLQKDIECASRNELQNYIYEQQAKKGHVAVNKERKISGARTHLSAEKQMWNQLSLLRTEEKVKFKFDFDKIEQLVGIYTNNYRISHIQHDKISA